jgi:alpha-1,3-mannosyltransferase
MCAFVRCVSEEVFLSRQFAVFMMLLHLRLLWAFADRKWFLEEGGAWNAVRMFFKNQGGEMDAGGTVTGVKGRRRDLTNERIASMVFVSNFIGILCARSLHYQFYSWYFHTIPFLLMGSRVPIRYTLPVYAMIEWCWNVFPSTVESSGVLLGCHMALLYLAYVHSGWP